MSDTKYNGWTNWETWNANLWLEGMEDIAQEYYDYAKGDDTFDKSENAAFAMADYLKELVEEMASEQLNSQASMIADFVNAGISQINFYEIAEGMIDACDKEQDSDAA